jgi:hypothetical protein
MWRHGGISWVAGCVLAALVAGGCTSHSAGSRPTAPTTSATSGPATAAPSQSAPAQPTAPPPSQPAQPSTPPPSWRAQPRTPAPVRPSDVTSEAPARQAAARTATATIVVRPVDRGGHLAAGYSAVPEANTDRMICDRNRVSPVAVDTGIFQCGASADYAVACWRSARRGTVLCDRDPFGRQLAQIPVEFVAVTDSAAPPPVPFGLELDNGERCNVRNGGAWSSPKQHPRWVGYYGCRSGDIVWAPVAAAATGGIDKSSSQWTVTVGAGSGESPLVRHRVVTARFVGMAPR